MVFLLYVPFYWSHPLHRWWGARLRLGGERNKRMHHHWWSSRPEHPSLDAKVTVGGHRLPTPQKGKRMNFRYAEGFTLCRKVFPFTYVGLSPQHLRRRTALDSHLNRARHTILPPHSSCPAKLSPTTGTTPPAATYSNNHSYSTPLYATHTLEQSN